jgi:hypothetical protein
MDENLLNALKSAVNPPDRLGKRNRLLRPKRFGRAARVIAQLYGLAAEEASLPEAVRADVAALLGTDAVERLEEVIQFSRRA